MISKTISCQSKFPDMGTQEIGNEIGNDIKNTLFAKDDVEFFNGLKQKINHRMLEQEAIAVLKSIIENGLGLLTQNSNEVSISNLYSALEKDVEIRARAYLIYLAYLSLDNKNNLSKEDAEFIQNFKFTANLLNKPEEETKGIIYEKTLTRFYQMYEKKIRGNLYQFGYLGEAIMSVIVAANNTALSL